MISGNITSGKKMDDSEVRRIIHTIPKKTCIRTAAILRKVIVVYVDVLFETPPVTSRHVARLCKYIKTTNATATTTIATSSTSTNTNNDEDDDNFLKQ